MYWCTSRTMTVSRHMCVPTGDSNAPSLLYSSTPPGTNTFTPPIHLWKVTPCDCTIFKIGKSTQTCVKLKIVTGIMLHKVECTVINWFKNSMFIHCKIPKSWEKWQTAVVPDIQEAEAEDSGA